jgi:mRNA interferase RelE/StbE
MSNISKKDGGNICESNIFGF